MASRSGILAGGNWIVDKLKFVETYPQQDARCNILSRIGGQWTAVPSIFCSIWPSWGRRFPSPGVGLIGADADGEWTSRSMRRA